MTPRQMLLMPWWLLTLATGAKSFSDHPLIGSRRLNRLGLHIARVRLADRLAQARRRRLAHRVSAEDRTAFERDGFVMRRDFLPAQAFATLREEVARFEGPAREMVQGDTITRRLALDPAALRAMPTVRALLRARDWRGLLRYAGSFDAEPVAYLQAILSQVRPGAPDPQTALHADTFHATVKAWLFLTDVAEDEGPFVYVPGSHRRTPERLEWERKRSLAGAGALDRLSARGSLRIAAAELAELGLPAPRTLAVPANTLVVADTSGFHARGPSARPSIRVELWAYGRRNPFLPWTGGDLGSLPGVAPRRARLMWATRDRLRGLIGQPWADAGMKGIAAPADTGE